MRIIKTLTKVLLLALLVAGATFVFHNTRPTAQADPSSSFGCASDGSSSCTLNDSGCSSTSTDKTDCVSGSTDCNKGVCSDPAATPNAPCTNQECDLVDKYINPTINLLSVMVGVVVVIAIILSGIQYSAAAGDPQKSASAKGHIANAIIALISYAFLYAFLQWVIPGGLLH